MSAPAAIITGVTRYIRRFSPAFQAIAVEPVTSPVIPGDSRAAKIQGIPGAGFIPLNLDTTLLNRWKPSRTRSLRGGAQTRQGRGHPRRHLDRRQRLRRGPTRGIAGVQGKAIVTIALLWRAVPVHALFSDPTRFTTPWVARSADAIRRRVRPGAPFNPSPVSGGDACLRYSGQRSMTT